MRRATDVVCIEPKRLYARNGARIMFWRGNRAPISLGTLRAANPLQESLLATYNRLRAARWGLPQPLTRGTVNGGQKARRLTGAEVRQLAPVWPPGRRVPTVRSRAW